MKKVFVKPEIQVMDLRLEGRIADGANKNQLLGNGECDPGLSGKPGTSCSITYPGVDPCPPKDHDSGEEEYTSI